MVKLSQREKRILGLVITFAVIFGIVIVAKQEYNIYRVRQEEIATQERITKLKAEEERLEKERQLLKEPKYLEKLAREEYNMVGKDEIPVFIVENQDTKEENKGK